MFYTIFCYNKQNIVQGMHYTLSTIVYSRPSTQADYFSKQAIDLFHEGNASHCRSTRTLRRSRRRRWPSKACSSSPGDGRDDPSRGRKSQNGRTNFNRWWTSVARLIHRISTTSLFFVVLPDWTKYRYTRTIYQVYHLNKIWWMAKAGRNLPTQFWTWSRNDFLIQLTFHWLRVITTTPGYRGWWANCRSSATPS